MGLPFRPGKYRLCWPDTIDGAEQNIEAVVAAFETIGSDVWAILENSNAHNLHFLDTIIPLDPPEEREPPPPDIATVPMDWDFDFKKYGADYFITDIESRIKAFGYCEAKVGQVEAKLQTDTAISPVWYPVKAVRMALLPETVIAMPAVLAETEDGDKWFPWFKIVESRAILLRGEDTTGDGAGD